VSRGPASRAGGAGESPAVALAMNALRADILSGGLAAGERVPEPAVMARYGVSRTTARVALQRVARAGLLVGAPTRGLAVSVPSSSELDDLTAVRSEVEPSLLQRFAARAGAADPVLLATALDALGSALTRPAPAPLEIEVARERVRAVLTAGAGSWALGTVFERERARYAHAYSQRWGYAAERARVAREARLLRRALPELERRASDAVGRRCRRFLEAEASGLASASAAGRGP